MITKKTIGHFGEELASSYLKKQGYKIVSRNYLTRTGEIDIICKKQKTLIFIEVKTRTNYRCGYPEEAITKTKVTHLISAVFEYLKNNPQLKNWQIDLVTIEMSRQFEPKITHWQDIIDENTYS